MAISAKALKNLKATFINNEIVVFLKQMNIAMPNPEGDVMDVTAMVQGFCVDIDGDYFYLGLPDGTVTRTISHDVAAMVEVSIPEDQIFMDLPISDEDVH